MTTGIRLNDSERLALSVLRDHAIGRTEVIVSSACNRPFSQR